jgi:hypothetical protein
MASTILNGSNNLTYTNNTGQNVRIVINYMQTADTSTGSIGLSWGNGASAAAATATAFGKNVAFSTGMISDVKNSKYNIINANGMIPFESGPSQHTTQALPSEIMLAPGQTFSATCGAYNIVVIPEAG